jgi:hypothetical protein
VNTVSIDTSIMLALAAEGEASAKPVKYNKLFI